MENYFNRKNLVMTMRYVEQSAKGCKTSETRVLFDNGDLQSRHKSTEGAVILVLSVSAKLDKLRSLKSLNWKILDLYPAIPSRPVVVYTISFVVTEDEMV